MKLTLALSMLLAAPGVTAFSASRPLTPTRAFVRGRQPLAMGILDEINSDDFNLLSSTDDEGPSKNKVEEAYEFFLGELVFSTNDPRVDIVNNLDRCADSEFLEWLDKKIEKSRDVEERTALRDLYDMIGEVQEKIEISKLAEEREERERQDAEKKRVVEAEAAAKAGAELSTAEVLKRAQAIDTSVQKEGAAVEPEEKKTFYDQELTPEIRMSYDKMLKKVLPPYNPGDTVESVVFNYYDQFDAQFVKVLNERASNGDEDSKVLLEGLAMEQQKKIGAATEVLKEVLALGNPMRMEGAIVKLAREGRIDEPFLLLLEANADQAKAAGAMGPAELMDKLRKRAMEEKDKQASSKEIRLIRQLLRADTGAEREAILVDAFTPRENLLVPGTAENAQKAVDGEAPEQEKPMPDVSPPDFINACKAVLLNFGNLGTNDDRGDLGTRLKQIAAEAEVVATRIYGKGMTLREQQDRAWKEETTSIFDLENMEIEAERMGEKAPWAANAPEDIVMPGFDATGKMKIGGD